MTKIEKAFTALLSADPPAPAPTASDIKAEPQVAEAWVRAVAEELGTGDRALAARVLGAWLKMLRNVLTPEALARFAAELPAGIESDFLTDRVQTTLPQKRDAKAYTIRFARAARIPVQDVSHVAPATTAAVRGQIPRAVDRAMAELSPALRGLITGRLWEQAC